MAMISGAARDNLPDSDFAFIEPGGTKDSDGNTTPRSKRHFPIQDAAHVRDALGRIGQGAQFGQEALPKVKAAATKLGVDVSKAETNGRETKTFNFKMDGEPDDEGRFTGHAAVFGNVDGGNDIIDPGACTKTLLENPTVPLFWQHDYSGVPIGVGTLTPDGVKGVRIDGQLFIESSDRAREVYGATKAKAVKGLSIGYNTIKRKFEGKVRRLQEIAIGEVSLCNSPMNPLALIDGVKSDMQFHLDALTDIAASADLTDVDREPIGSAIKSLVALLEQSEPVDDHSEDAGAAKQEASEPDPSTLQALKSLMDDIAKNDN